MVEVVSDAGKKTGHEQATLHLPAECQGLSTDWK